MIKQSKLSKICWAIVYFLPTILGFATVWLTASPEGGLTSYLTDVFVDHHLPYFNIQFFASSPLVELIAPDTAAFLDVYLGYLILVSLFRIVWKVLVYLPDVVGKLIDRWSL